MMNRLQCTYTELQRQPAAEMAVFVAFAEGEDAAEKAIREANPNK